MAEVVERRKACTENPLRLSQPFGAGLAFLGMADAMPVLHGTKGCTSFAMVTLVKHFREAIPFQSTAMEEITAVLGGHDNVRQALLNVRARTGAKLIGLCSTGLTEVRGEDLSGDVAAGLRDCPELGDTVVVHVSTPDYAGSMQDGWGKAVKAMIEQAVLAPAPAEKEDGKRVAILPGSHLTPADIDELRAVVEAFGLIPLIVPDLSGSLDGHMPEPFRPVTLGGAGVDTLRELPKAVATIAVGEQMRPAALALFDKASVPFEVFERLTGLAAVDRLVTVLADLSGAPVPAHLRRQRSRLVDAMLDAHFFVGGARFGIAADPDLLWSLAWLVSELGGEIGALVTTTRSPLLARVPAERVVIGDLADFEAGARGCDLLISNSHAAAAAERLGAPLLRVGYPIHDRLGVQHVLSVGYRGTADLIFRIGNLLLAHHHPPSPDRWRNWEAGHDDAQVPAH